MIGASFNLVSSRYTPGDDLGTIPHLGIVMLLASASAAQAGPCNNQIAAVEQQINQSAAVSPPGGAGTPSASQTVGAQLHHTPGTVENAERKANAEGDAALERARKADVNGDADACIEALREARHLYGLD